MGEDGKVASAIDRRNIKRALFVTSARFGLFSISVLNDHHDAGQNRNFYFSRHRQLLGTVKKWRRRYMLHCTDWILLSGVRALTIDLKINTVSVETKTYPALFHWLPTSFLHYVFSFKITLCKIHRACALGWHFHEHVTTIFIISLHYILYTVFSTNISIQLTRERLKKKTIIKFLQQCHAPQL